LPTAHGAIFGAHLVFQQVLAAEKATAGKRVLSLQTTFANGGRSGEPVTISIETMQSGRSFATLAITFRQQQVVLTRALALMTADEDDYLRHQIPAATTTDWASWPIRYSANWPGWIRRSPASSLEQVSLCFGLDESVSDPSVARALLAAGTEYEVMGAMLDFAGVPAAPAGKMPANVLTHTVTLLEPIDPRALVMTIEPTYTGHGRVNGSGRVVDEQGLLLATFTTTGVLRAPRA
jgi:acyl-CoA thioesterase-2